METRVGSSTGASLRLLDNTFNGKKFGLSERIFVSYLLFFKDVPSEELTNTDDVVGSIFRSYSVEKDIPYTFIILHSSVSSYWNKELSRSRFQFLFISKGIIRLSDSLHSSEHSSDEFFIKKINKFIQETFTYDLDKDPLALATPFSPPLTPPVTRFDMSEMLVSFDLASKGSESSSDRLLRLCVNISQEEPGYADRAKAMLERQLFDFLTKNLLITEMSINPDGTSTFEAKLIL